MYSEKILQIFANPKNVGIIKNGSALGEATNEFGEIVKIFINVEDNIITEAKFKAYGGVVVIATGSVLTTQLKGLDIDEAVNISTKDLVAKLGGEVDENKLPSVAVVKDAMLLAIKIYKDSLVEEVAE